MNQSPNLINWLLTNQMGSAQNMGMPMMPQMPMMSQNQQTQPPINQSQFQQYAHKITDDNLKQLVVQARQQGISEEESKRGLEFSMNVREFNSLCGRRKVLSYNIFLEERENGW